MNKSGDEYLPPRSEEEDMMSQTHPASLGIDVAKVKFAAALLCEGKLAQRTFVMDPEGVTAVDHWIHQRGIEQVHACLEATGEYGAALALVRRVEMLPKTGAARMTVPHRTSRVLPATFATPDRAFG